MPSFPAPGLGGVISVRPAKWLMLRTAAYEGSPQIESFGFDSASQPGAGVFTIATIGVTHTFGVDQRHGGTTTVGVWHHTGTFEAPTRGTAAPREIDGNEGFYAIHDERIYEKPKDKDNTEGLHLFVRFAWAPPDRNDNDRYLGGGIAYHGMPWAENHTVGVGFGTLHYVVPAGGSPGDGTEMFVEAFYKARFTKWVSLEPDFQFFRRPGGDGRDAVVLGTRFKVKL
jgi:porin